MSFRITGALAALAGTAVLAAGCGNEQPAPPGSTPTPAPTTAAPTTPTLTPPARPAPTKPSPTTDPSPLRRGADGPAVRAIQQRMAELGYWIGRVDGRFGALTEQAVYALQKAAGIARDGVVGPETRAALDRGVRPSARTVHGRVVEVDLDRQLLLLVDNGRVEQILNTSTGTFEYYWHGGDRYLTAGIRDLSATCTGRSTSTGRASPCTGIRTSPLIPRRTAASG
jgi:hypothetical protein